MGPASRKKGCAPSTRFSCAMVRCCRAGPLAGTQLPHPGRRPEKGALVSDAPDIRRSHSSTCSLDARRRGPGQEAPRHPGTVPDCLPTQIFNTNPDGSRIRIPHSVWTIALRNERVALVGPCGFFSFAAQSPRPLSGRLGLPAECLETGKKMVPTECAFTQYIALPLSALVRSGPEPTSRKELNAELRRTLQPEKCRCSFSRASLSCQARVDGCYVKRQRICGIPTLVGYQQPDSRC